jgi:hypothetical protein
MMYLRRRTSLHGQPIEYRAPINLATSVERSIQNAWEEASRHEDHLDRFKMFLSVRFERHFPDAVVGGPDIDELLQNAEGKTAIEVFASVVTQYFSE